MKNKIFDKELLEAIKFVISALFEAVGIVACAILIMLIVLMIFF